MLEELSDANRADAFDEVEGNMRFAGVHVSRLNARSKERQKTIFIVR